MATIASLLRPCFCNKDNQQQNGEEDSVGRRKIKKGGWKTMPFIIGNETCEKLATIGLIANMIIYLTNKFNMSNVTASNVLNILSGTTSMSPVLGAFLSDSYIGRYWTIALGCIANFMGTALLTMTAIFPNLRPLECKNGPPCARPNTREKTLLYSSFALLTVGSAGIRPCSVAFGADQFDHTTEKGREHIQTFFNWYYFSFTIATMVSLTIVVYIQDSISWSLGLAIPSALMLVSTVCFFLGRKIYVIVKPEGSPFTGFAQVIVAAIRKRHVKVPAEPSDYEGVSKSGHPLLTNQFKFLNKACVKGENDTKAGGQVDPWRLCSTEKVEEFKLILRIAPIWAGCMGLMVTGAQLGTFSVLQAETMDRHLGKRFQIPAGSFGIFSMLSFTLFLPVYDRLIVPLSIKLSTNTKGITPLQRIGIGQAISIVPMAVAALVEKKRRHLAVLHGFVDKPRSAIPMSAMWLLPQYAIAGISEAFISIGANEFIYSQFPQGMKSVAGALFFLTFGIGNYISTLLVTVVHKTTNWLDQNLNQARLDRFYWLLLGITVLNLAFFVVAARWYKYKEEDGDAEGGQDQR